MANLLAASLRNCQPEEFQSVMSVSCLSSIQLDGEQYNSVIELFQFSLNQLPKPLGEAYYSFLYFDPMEPISVIDLAILWNLDLPTTMRRCALFDERCLIRKASNPPTEEEHWYIHQMLHEAAAMHAAEQLGLVGQTGYLAKIRLKLITGKPIMNYKQKTQIQCKIISKTINRYCEIEKLIKALNQRRLLLLSKTVEKLEAADLGQLCRHKSEATDGMTFLHFLYSVDWAVQHNAYFGSSISYRLVREIVFKLREFRVDFTSLVNEDRNFEMTKRDGEPRNLMRQLFGEINAWRYTPDRNSLVETLGLSVQKLNEDQKWEEKFKAINETFREFLQILDSQCDEPGKRFDEFMERVGAKSLNKSDQNELMLCAARKGCLEIVVKLSELFPKAGQHRTRSGVTAAMLAAASGHVNVVNFLCERYNDSAKVKDSCGWTALHHAVINGQLEVVDYLTKRTPNCPWSELLLMACANGSIDLVEYLCDKNPQSIATADEHTGLTAMMVAAKFGHFLAIDYLHLVDPLAAQSVDKRGWTAMSHAAAGGHCECVEFLYQAFKDAIALADHDGLTPLMIAARFGHVAVVVFLAHKFPNNVLAQDKDGRTALMLAAASGHTDVIRQLNHFEVSLGRCNTTGDSASFGKLIRSEKQLTIASSPYA